MRDAVSMMVGMQMLGFVMKTGACPQPGDLQNMVNAAVKAHEKVLAVEPEVWRMEREADQRLSKVREAAP